MSKKSIACIVYNQNTKNIFIAKRIPVGDMGGKWEFPGGKVEQNEETVVAIEREMMEEFSVKANVFEKIAETQFIHRQDTVTLEAYKVTFEHDGMEKPFVLTEHTEYKWINPENIPQLDFVDSDMKIYPEVMKYIKSL